MIILLLLFNSDEVYVHKLDKKYANNHSTIAHLRSKNYHTILTQLLLYSKETNDNNNV